MEPLVQQIIELLLTAPSKHGDQHRDNGMLFFTPVCGQPKLSPNFFQETAPASHSVPSQDWHFFNQMEPFVQQIIELLLTAPSKHGD
jgi:hypothetical protein